MEELHPLDVSTGALTAIIVLSNIVGAIIILLLWQTISIRNTQVFQLTQGKFLIAMQICALLTTSSLALFKPTDVFCRIGTPLIYLPMHTVYAILLGRMWRVRAVISPLLLLTLEKKEHWTTRTVNWVNRLTASRRSGEEITKKKIRTTITDGQLTRVVCLLVFPQFVTQILILSHQKNEIELYNNLEIITEGMMLCKYGVHNSALHILSIILIFVEFLSLGVLTYASRKLPSLFNETKLVWSILKATFVMLVSGILLIIATIDHHNTADVRFLVPSFTIGLNMGYVCWNITFSKLQLAWKGKKILVTKLIADHNFSKTREKDSTSVPAYEPTLPITKRISLFMLPKQVTKPATPEKATGNSSKHGNGGADEIGDDDTDDGSTDSSVVMNENDKIDVVDLDGTSHSIQDSIDDTSDSKGEKIKKVTNQSHQLRSQRNLSRDTSRVIRRRLVNPRRSQTVLARGGPLVASAVENVWMAQRRHFSIFGQRAPPVSVIVESAIRSNPRLQDNKITISETEAPGRRLLLRMIDVQRTLTEINKKLLTGISVEKEDWDSARSGCIGLGEVFQNEVFFDWEDEESIIPLSNVERDPPLSAPPRGSSLLGKFNVQPLTTINSVGPMDRLEEEDEESGSLRDFSTKSGISDLSSEDNVPERGIRPAANQSERMLKRTSSPGLEPVVHRTNMTGDFIPISSSRFQKGTNLTSSALSGFSDISDHSGGNYEE